MADFTLTITIPDPKVDEVVDALRAYFRKNNDGSEKTITELKEEFRLDAIRRIKRMHEDYMRKNAAVADSGVL